MGALRLLLALTALCARLSMSFMKPQRPFAGSRAGAGGLGAPLPAGSAAFRDAPQLGASSGGANNVLYAGGGDGLRLMSVGQLRSLIHDWVRANDALFFFHAEWQAGGAQRTPQLYSQWTVGLKKMCTLVAARC